MRFSSEKQTKNNMLEIVKIMKNFGLSLALVQCFIQMFLNVQVCNVQVCAEDISSLENTKSEVKEADNKKNSETKADLSQSKKTKSKTTKKSKNVSEENSSDSAAKDKNIDPAEPEQEKATNLDINRPYSEEARKEYNQGVELHQQGFLNQAIQKYKNAIQADDRLESAYCNLGLIYISQRNFAKANDAFKKAIILKPNNPYSLNGLGTVLYTKGKVTEAMEKWQKAVEIDPNFASAFFNMGNAWETEKDQTKAIESYVSAIKVNTKMADAYYRVGSIFAKQKHIAQAQWMLAKACQLAPEAEFVNDAQKQISGIQVSLNKEDDKEPEVKMNVVQPDSSNSSTDEASSDSKSN